jgi:hypothetical protein
MVFLLKPRGNRIDLLNCPLDSSGASPARLNGDVLWCEHLCLKQALPAKNRCGIHTHTTSDAEDAEQGRAALSNG